MYTPQVTKKPTIHTNNAKFSNHFPFRTMVNGTLKFTANCAKSAQFANPCPELHEICTLHILRVKMTDSTPEPTSQSEVM